jgi:hypothetical protein
LGGLFPDNGAISHVAGSTWRYSIGKFIVSHDPFRIKCSFDNGPGLARDDLATAGNLPTTRGDWPCGDDIGGAGPALITRKRQTLQGSHPAGEINAN